jgi:tetratricopeptide (TPR) repeat protein
MTLLGSLTRLGLRTAKLTAAGRGGVATANMLDKLVQSSHVKRVVRNAQEGFRAGAAGTTKKEEATKTGSSTGSSSTSSRAYTTSAALRFSSSSSSSASAAPSSTVKRIGAADATAGDLVRDQSAEVRTLREQAGQDMSEQKFPTARATLLKALDVQQAIFLRELTPSSFFVLVSLLSDIVTCVRMSGVDPRDLSALDAVLAVYETQALPQFLAKSPAAHAAALEHPAVYSFICSTAGCLIDAEAFTRAKDLLNKHMLHDLSTSTPSSIEGAYDLKDLRMASALNFRGIALFSDHSACSGHGHGGHGHHHHAHDHKEAEVAWQRAKEFTQGFVKLVQETKPVGKLDQTDALMLQANSIISDNLAQVCLADGRNDEAVALSKADVETVQSAFTPYSPLVISTQAQALKMLLETQHMDDAEVFTEQMLSAFPHPKPGVDSKVSLAAIPDEVTVQTAAIYDELSIVMHQFQNLDYSEKFLQISLAILRARLVDPQTGKLHTVHPALARAENGLGLIQLQARDYDNAEKHLEEALKMKIALAELGYTASSPAQDDPQHPAAAAQNQQKDDGLAEFYHNLGLAKFGLKKLSEAEDLLHQAREKYHLRYTDPVTGSKNLVHATYAGLCSQLSKLYRMSGKDEKALEASNEALKLKQQLFAPTSTQLLDDLYNSSHLTANVFHRYAEAIPLYRQVVSILERPIGSRPPESGALGAALHWLANSYDKSLPREPAMAAETWRKAIGQVRKTMPGMVLPLQENLLRVVKELGGREAEEKQIEQAMQETRQIIEKEEKAKEERAQQAAKGQRESEGEEGAPFTYA